MTTVKSTRRSLIKAGACLGGAAMLGAPAVVLAQETKLRFILDWRMEGGAAPWLYTLEKGYFKNEGLDVTIDAGSGSSAAIQRVASGAYEIGFGDFNSIIEFMSNNAADPNARVQGVYVVYEQSPAAVFALKKSGIVKPKDLEGKKLGAPVFDGGRKAFPIFAKANGIDLAKINWTSMDAALRETMLVRGEVDAITGFYFSGLMSLLARGAKEEDIVSMRYMDHNARMYGSTIITTPKFAQANSKAVAGFVKAFNRGLKETLAKPQEALAFVKKRDALIDEALELRRWKLIADNFVLTPETKKSGLGDVDKARFATNVAQVVDALGLKTPVDPATVFTAQFLPAAAERKV
jgi:NitT/TauT family transport system substrate-binding protein